MGKSLPCIGLYDMIEPINHLGLHCLYMFLFCMHSACSQVRTLNFRLTTPLASSDI